MHVSVERGEVALNSQGVTVTFAAGISVSVRLPAYPRVRAHLGGESAAFGRERRRKEEQVSQAGEWGTVPRPQRFTATKLSASALPDFTPAQNHILNPSLFFLFSGTAPRFLGCSRVRGSDEPYYCPGMGAVGVSVGEASSVGT